MSAVAKPRGPLPARVYWVRRAVVLGTAFLLIFGLARVLGSGSDGDGDQPKADATAEQAAGEHTTDASEATDGPSSAGPTTTKTPKAKKTKTPLPAPTGDCDPADITVEPDLDRVAWSNKIKIPFRLTGVDEACTFEVSISSIAIKITSGSDLIWTSQQCDRVPSEDVVVRSATTTTVTFEWNGRRSDDGCTRTADFAKPGWYHIEVAAFGGEPTSDKFELTKPKPVKVYKTQKPKPKNKKTKKPSGSADPTNQPSPSGAVEPNG